MHLELVEVREGAIHRDSYLRCVETGDRIQNLVISEYTNMEPVNNRQMLRCTFVSNDMGAVIEGPGGAPANLTPAQRQGQALRLLDVIRSNLFERLMDDVALQDAVDQLEAALNAPPPLRRPTFLPLPFPVAIATPPPITQGTPLRVTPNGALEPCEEGHPAQIGHAAGPPNSVGFIETFLLGNGRTSSFLSMQPTINGIPTQPNPDAGRDPLDIFANGATQVDTTEVDEILREARDRARAEAFLRALEPAQRMLADPTPVEVELSEKELEELTCTPTTTA